MEKYITYVCNVEKEECGAVVEHIRGFAKHLINEKNPQYTKCQKKATVRRLLSSTAKVLKDKHQKKKEPENYISVENAMDNAKHLIFSYMKDCGETKSRRKCSKPQHKRASRISERDSAFFNLPERLKKPADEVKYMNMQLKPVTHTCERKRLQETFVAFQSLTVSAEAHYTESSGSSKTVTYSIPSNLGKKSSTPTNYCKTSLEKFLAMRKLDAAMNAAGPSNSPKVETISVRPKDPTFEDFLPVKKSAVESSAGVSKEHSALNDADPEMENISNSLRKMNV